MLKPAILYERQIEMKLQKIFYTNKTMFLTGSLDSFTTEIARSPERGIYQYAVVDENDNLTGYLSYRIDFYDSCAYGFCIISFIENNLVLARDLYNELEKLIHEFNLHRIEWRMVGGNPVERNYDNFCNKYHGRKIELKDTFKDSTGKYHNSYIYEIIND